MDISLIDEDFVNWKALFIDKMLWTDEHFVNCLVMHLLI